jgi:hypothetical protein
MGGINMKRWIMGGLAAGVVMWVIEGAASQLYIADMDAAMAAHNLSMEMSAATMAMGLIVSFIAGLAIVFFYAASRPRFGPGPGTAIKVAVVLWFGGYLLSLLGYDMMDLFPNGLLVTWGIIGLVEMIIAALVGGWLYREEPPAHSTPA